MFGRIASSLAMLRAFVTTVSGRSATARATSVVVVPPVSPITAPSWTRRAASSPIRRFCSCRLAER
jgi:hypothetical protein